ncbi:MAG TPA: tetratricopeptide repeat protein [Opitutaceae bacterium]|jgi:tetratricopeptide (TPR) repeat protein|nr:tetratricopeptide repeat protein [Opitutaceae bacterium]
MSKRSRARAAARTSPKAAASAEASAPSKPNARFAHRAVLLAGGFIVLATLAAYFNSFSGPFVFDDVPGIKENPSIHHLWQSLIPPHETRRDSGLPVAGRPIVNLSLAVNYAFGGLDPWGYHAFNLLIHTLAALTLFGIVRRTLECGRGALTPRATQTRGFQISDFKSKIVEGPATAQSEISNLKSEIFQGPPTVLALAVALLWVLHPLQTEAVTFISQRAESLMGLFYLLTLYCFVRGVEGAQTSNAERRTPNAESPTTNYELPTTERRRLSSYSSSLWILASVGACLLGMASKEVMISAPLIVLLYDRTFVAGSFRAAWKKRWRFYAGLASTWLLLGFLVAGTKGRGGTAGFGANITSWSYALTQFRAIVHYLQLSLWPHPLIFDYGTALATRAAEIVPYAVIVLLLLAVTVVALWRRPALGFAGAWFFAILAPSSSVVPVVTQTMAEHRMYLALVPVIVLIVLGLHSLLGRRSEVLLLAMAVGLGCVTARRNEDYRSALAIWSDTVAKCPGNVRAHYNLGDNLRLLGRSQDAITEFRTAIRLEPRYAQAHDSLANLLEKIPGRMPEAISEYKTAIRLDPNFAEPHYNLALAIADLPGRLPEAISEYEAALRIKPDDPEAQVNLGNALSRIPGRLSEAISAYQAAIRINPDLAQAHYDLAETLSDLPGRMPEAISEYETVVRLEPGLAGAQCNLGIALAESGRTTEGIAHLEAAVRIQPDFVDAHTALGTALVQAQQYPEAISQFQQALRIQPDSTSAYNNLGTAMLRMGRFPEAADQFNAALKIDPGFSTARLNLAVALSQMNRGPEAIQQLESVLQSNADDETAAKARNLLSQLRPASHTAP